MSYKTEFIDFMIDSGVLLFGDFVTKSGRKTPYFINTGNYRTGRQISMLGGYYAKVINEELDYKPDVLFGPAYKGIPLSVAAASALYREYGQDCEYCFNRKEEKDHGEGKILIGAALRDGMKVVITEDVITAGTSIRETLPVLRAAANVSVSDLIISVDRKEKGTEGISATEQVMRDFGIKVHPIVTIEDIIDYIDGSLDGDIIRRMKEYREEYCV